MRAVEVSIGEPPHPDISHVALEPQVARPGPSCRSSTPVGAGRAAAFANTELLAAGSSLGTGPSPFTGPFRADGDLGAVRRR